MTWVNLARNLALVHRSLTIKTAFFRAKAKNVQFVDVNDQIKKT